MPSGNAQIVLVAKFCQKVKFENEVISEALIQGGKKINNNSDSYMFFSLCSQKYRNDD
jgi:hypothetical protein